MAIIDVTTFNGEFDLFELRYQILKDIVDEFIVVVFDETFSGQHRDVTSLLPYTHDYPKATFVRHGADLYEKYRELAESSPNTAGADHWKREFMQKESIKDALTHLKDDDIVFIGDVDEIWDINGMEDLTTYKLKLRVYTYWLNNHSSEEFWGTLVAPYGIIKNECLNHLRTSAPKSETIHGWHFTSMGGADALTKKLTDSYTQESYATPAVLENIAYNIDRNADFLGRDFTYTTDEQHWPNYLKDNREKYIHLMKPE